MTGFIAGVGFSALGLYLYKKNKSQVDEFLKSHGIEIAEERNFGDMTIEQLTEEKERLEDLIAEREMDQKAD